MVRALGGSEKRKELESRSSFLRPPGLGFAHGGRKDSPDRGNRINYQGSQASCLSSLSTPHQVILLREFSPSEESPAHTLLKS